MKKILTMFLVIPTSLSVLAQPEFTPNDPLLSQQWGLNNVITGFDIDAQKAWALERGNKNVAMVVIDTGIDYTHPDLANNMWVNPNEIANNGIDDDGNGYIDDMHGINTLTGSGDPMDDQGHGTHIAGVIGAEGNNVIGIAGVMHKVSLIACKFLAKDGGGSTEGAIKCLDYVADLARRDIGTTIVATVNAWGGGPESEALRIAIEKHRDLGILFVTTSGGSASNIDDDKVYPAAYDVDNVIVTAYMASTGHMTSFSSYGPNTVHVASPGEEILSTLPNGKYESWSGSAAVGFVAGAVGLMKAHNPHLSYLDLKNCLIEKAESLATPEEQAKVQSGGFVNAYRCLAE